MKAMIFLLLIVVLLLSSDQFSIAQNQAVTTIKSGDWTHCTIKEAFPEAVENLYAKSKVGGVSFVGTASKGSIAANEAGSIAVAYGVGVVGADVEVRRCLVGHGWETLERPKGISAISDAAGGGMGGVSATLSYPNSGPGPQVAMDETGNVCIAYPDDNGKLLSEIWLAKDGSSAKIDKISSAQIVQNCAATYVVHTISYCRLYCFDDVFYLVGIPQRPVSEVQVYRLKKDTWIKLGGSLKGNVRLCFDEKRKELYCGAVEVKDNVGSYPAVFQYIKRQNIWKSLENPSTPGSLREPIGISSAPCKATPFTAAYDGQVWAFWNETEDWLQAALWKDGHWQSCAQIKSLDPQTNREVTRESFGAGQGAFYLGFNSTTYQCNAKLAFFDPESNQVVMSIDGIHNGCISNSSAQGIYPVPSGKLRKTESGWIPNVGEGFDTFVRTSEMFPQTVALTRCGNKLLFLATMMNQGTRGSDVFAFEISPSASP